ncbi:hypothetical protein IWW35_000206 [Coemansia sp. RSA 1878]|nr:hypothetical protein IWW35_000206 [Coemansia sp. RSA 1878]
MPQLVQVLKLPIHASTNPHTADSAKPIPAGLNLVFAACPSCAHKATARPEWICTHCGLEIRSSDIVWTYRLRISAVNGSNAETTLGILGSVADAWFGCGAAEWVDEVGRGLQALVRCELDVDDVVDRVFAVVGVATGVVGHYAVLDLRKISARAKQCSVARIRSLAETGAVCSDTRISFLSVWKYVVYDVVTHAVAQSDGVLGRDSEVQQVLELFGADARALAVINQLVAPHAMTEFASTGTHGCETTQSVDSGRVLLFWDSVCARVPDVPIDADTLGDSQIDDILNNSSQLFHFDCSAPDVASECMLSMHLLEESLRDDQLHSLVFNSQAEYESQLVFVDSEAVFGGSFTYSPSSTFLRGLEATPQVSQYSWPATPRPVASTQGVGTYTVGSFCHTSGSENVCPIVLADETPGVRGEGSKRRIEFCVPETPTGVRTVYPDVLGKSSIQAVPETPTAKSTGVYKHTNVQKRTRKSNAVQKQTKRPLTSLRSQQRGERYRPLQMADSRNIKPRLVKMVSETPASARVHPLNLQRSSSCEIGSGSDKPQTQL